MRHALIAALLILVACDKSKSVAETPQPPPSAKATPTPSAPRWKEGPTPDDPLLANVAPMPMPPPSETKPLATASNAFAFDLWARTSKTPGNAAFSPASISLALAMVWLGANGDTASQMKKTMHFDGTPDATAASWGKLARVMSTPPRALKLRIANRLFGEKTYKFEAPYIEKTGTLFGAPLEAVDFKTAFEPARMRINGWVEEQTEKRIVDLLPSKAITDSARLVLVNAIYFLADWDDPFEKKWTTDGPFEISPASKKDVPTMHGTGKYAIAQTGGVKVLELPYKGGDASMIFVLPDKKDGLPAVEKSLDATKLAAWRKALARAQVDVALPRFEIRPETMSLANELVALGMPLAFDKAKADFTGMGKSEDPSERLSIGTVFHKAFVKVDEKGTEAAAATAVALSGGGIPDKPIEFHADHPFLFFIVEKTSGLVLFMGRVADPSVK